MAKVIAVSVSIPKLVDIGGRQMSTAIVRDPYEGALFFDCGGPVGNRTAVHTEHVLATISENYDFWTQRLGVAREAWPPCFWGENLTLSGLSEHTLRVGDRLAIGASAVLEVTSPRIPCTGRSGVSHVAPSNHPSHGRCPLPAGQVAGMAAVCYQ